MKSAENLNPVMIETNGMTIAKRKWYDTFKAFLRGKRRHPVPRVEDPAGLKVKGQRRAVAIPGSPEEVRLGNRRAINWKANKVKRRVFVVTRPELAQMVQERHPGVKEHVVEQAASSDEEVIEDGKVKLRRKPKAWAPLKLIVMVDFLDEQYYSLKKSAKNKLARRPFETVEVPALGGQDVLSNRVQRIWVNAPFAEAHPAAVEHVGDNLDPKAEPSAFGTHPTGFGSTDDDRSHPHDDGQGKPRLTTHDDGERKPGPRVSLTEADRKQVASLIKGAPQRPRNSPVATFGAYHLFPDDLLTLRPGGWVVGFIIDAYGHLIQAEAKHVQVLTTEFYAVLADNQDGTLRLDTHSDIRNGSWDLLIPARVNRNHWICVYVDRRARRIEVYDSLQGRKNKGQVFDNLIHWLNNGSTVPVWTLVSGANPHQHNFNDCGVFVMQFMLHLARNRDSAARNREGGWGFAQENMPEVRIRVIKELFLDGALMAEDKDSHDDASL